MTIELAADAESDDLSASAHEFFHAWRHGDMTRITQLLAPDCEWYRDGQPIALTDKSVFERLDPAATAADITPEVVNVHGHSASALLLGDAEGSNNARRPVGFINLKFEVGGIAKVSEARLPVLRGVASPSRPSGGFAVARAGAKLVAVVLYFLIDELLFSIPVVAVAALWDPWAAFVLLTPIYVAFAMIVGLVVSRVRQRTGAVSGSALQRWLDAKTTRRETNWERRALIGFGFLGTGVVTIILGPILTPWLAHRLGLDRRYGTVVVGSVFWSVCQVGTYSGLMALIL